VPSAVVATALLLAAGSADHKKRLLPAMATGETIVIKEGRFGPYLTDGTVNRTMPRGETIEEITLARAAELLADKRAEGPKPKKKRGGTKAAAKRSGAATKKTAAKKSAAKKAAGAKKAASKKAPPSD